MTEKTPQPGSPPLEVPADLEAIYVNVIRIAHSPAELVFDLAHLFPGSSPAKVRARMVMSPLGAKLFYHALGENLKRYEAAYGKIKVPGQRSLADYLFQPPKPPDEPSEE